MTEAQSRATGLYMVFSAGTRPDAATLRAAVADIPRIRVSHDPEVADDGSVVDEAVPTDWLELLIDGLTFDCLGLAPAAPADLPPAAHRFDVPEGLQLDSCEALELRPGPHLSGGERSLPIVRTLAGLASMLAGKLEGFAGVIWPPASSFVGVGFFRSTVDAWLSGGPFPALGLTAFTRTMDGGLQSIGLDWFIGQEVRIEPGLAEDAPSAIRLGIRLVNQLVASGPIGRPEEITGPDGHPLRLVPSEDGRLVCIGGRIA